MLYMTKDGSRYSRDPRWNTSRVRRVLWEHDPQVRFLVPNSPRKEPPRHYREHHDTHGVCQDHLCPESPKEPS